MATIDAAAIVAAIQSRLDGTSTDLRVVAAGTLDGDIFDDLPAAEQARRALVTPRFDVSMISVTPRGWGPLGDTELVDFRVAVRSIYALTTLHAASETALLAVRAQAADNVERIRQALQYPGSVGPGAGNVTTLVGGALWQSFGARLVKESFADNRIEWLSEFGGTAAVRVEGDVGFLTYQATVGSSLVRYLPGGVASRPAFPAPRTMLFSAMDIDVTANTLATDATVELLQTGSTTAQTLTVTALATGIQRIVTPVAMAQGDTWDIRVTNVSGGGGNSITLSVTLTVS